MIIVHHHLKYGDRHFQSDQTENANDQFEEKTMKKSKFKKTLITKNNNNSIYTTFFTTQR